MGNWILYGLFKSDLAWQLYARRRRRRRRRGAGAVHPDQHMVPGGCCLMWTAA
eukprot:SAG31_NODE_27739_length_421_cov_0.614907_1_plen_52_part_10